MLSQPPLAALRSNFGRISNKIATACISAIQIFHGMDSLMIKVTLLMLMQLNIDSLHIYIGLRISKYFHTVI